jgi:uncharacterized protein YqcC (DUF446 family)
MSKAVECLLNELEAELRQQQLWHTSPPDKAAMASTQPFCYDTLALEQWLQFIFIPRMQALLDTNTPLPQAVNILPMAELAFQHNASAMAAILDIIRRIDNTLSGGQ